MKAIIRFIHQWQNRNTFLAYNPSQIEHKQAISLANRMSMGLIMVNGLKEQIKIISKETNG